MRALLFAVVLAGCSKTTKTDPGPPCSKVVENMLVVMKAGMTGHDSVELGNRDQMIEQCEARKLSAGERTCMVTAKDLAALASCRKAPPAPVPTRPLPTGSAGSGG